SNSTSFSSGITPTSRLPECVIFDETVMPDGERNTATIRPFLWSDFSGAQIRYLEADRAGTLFAVTAVGSLNMTGRGCFLKASAEDGSFPSNVDTIDSTELNSMYSKRLV